MDYLLSFPSLVEQKKITKLLNLIDIRISVQSKVIKDLKKLKGAISQDIFNRPPLRHIRLSEYIRYGKAGGTLTSTNKEYYNGRIPFLSINDITKQGKYISQTENYLSEAGIKASSAWLVPSGSLILSMYASVGITTINTIPLATSQAMFSMILNTTELIDYLYYFLCYFKDRLLFRYLETGTQSNINAETVKSIMVPDYGDNNIKYGRILSTLDKRIDNESKILTHFYTQKAFILANLFI